MLSCMCIIYFNQPDEHAYAFRNFLLVQDNIYIRLSALHIHPQTPNNAEADHGASYWNRVAVLKQTAVRRAKSHDSGACK
jgi:hypothetical protein